MTTTNLPSTVTLVIPTESVQEVVMLLLSNHISFTLTSSNYTEKTPNAIKKIDEISTYNNEEPQNVFNQKINALEAIYRKYLEENIAKVPPNEAQIAEEYGMTLVSFKNAFKNAYGKTFYQLHMEKKMAYAKTLLLQGHKAVNVAKRIGYSEKSAIKFNKMFQKHFGVTPKKFQMSRR